MKVIIDLIEDLEQSIQNQEDFVMGVICLDSNEENMVALWGQAISHFEINHDKKEMHFFVGSTPIKVKDFLEATKDFDNKELMYSIFVSTQDNPSSAASALLGFSEVLESKQYRLLIVE
jgi:hypothetical protein